MDWSDEDESQRRKQRRRLNPVKKWTFEETEAIINYCYKSKNFELPTTRRYYSEMSKALNLNCSFNLIRCKLRNMKVKYLKARDLINELSQSTSDKAKAKIERIRSECPFYDELEKIFERQIKIYDKTREHAPPYKNTNDSGEGKIDVSNIKKTYSDCSESVDDDCWANEESLDSKDTTQDSQGVAIEENFNQFHPNAERMIDWDPNLEIEAEPLTADKQFPVQGDSRSESKYAPIDKFLNLERRKQRLKEERLRFEKQKYRLDYELNLRKQKFEEDQWKQRLELQKRELEQKERLLKYQLSLKYCGKDTVNLDNLCGDS